MHQLLLQCSSQDSKVCNLDSMGEIKGASRKSAIQIKKIRTGIVIICVFTTVARI